MADLENWSHWLESIPLSRPFALEPLDGGQNNRAYRLRTARGSFCLKHYSDNARLLNELEILTLLRGLAVPAPLAMSAEHSLAVLEFIEGRPLTTADLEQGVEGAVELLRSMQASRFTRAASDSSLDPQEHLDKVGERVRACLTELGEDFLESQLRWRWERQLEMPVPAPLPSSQWILSPSDFGFHNALLRPSGQLCFVDFEYAGLDDPAKTICDFYAQPRLPVPLTTLPRFGEFVTEPVLERMEWMWRLTLIKWACILMNPFLQATTARKRFSGAPADLSLQVAKVQLLFTREQPFLDELTGCGPRGR